MTKLKTIDIKGKKYVPVNERLKYFRENYPLFSLETEIVEVTENTVLLRAVIRNEEGRIIATGLAHEIAGDSHINKTSHIENCESSAWGRALGNFGIGIDDTVASHDEVIAAQNREKIMENTETKKKPSITLVMETLTEATDVVRAEKILTKALEHDWSEADRKTIKDCYNNTIQKFL